MTTPVVRRAVRCLVHDLVEAANWAGALVTGAVGAWVAYRVSPAVWSIDSRVLTAGVGAGLAFVAGGNAVDAFFTSMRHRLRDHTASTTAVPAAPATLDEALAQVTAATEVDAAHRAALEAHRLDDGGGFLRQHERWRGYETGEASCYLAPGLTLYYRSTRTTYGIKAEFTLLSANDDTAVPVASLPEIRHHLRRYADGLPVAEVVPVDDCAAQLAEV